MGEIKESKVAIVTGAASGIGAALTRHLIDTNHLVLGVDINSSKLNALSDDTGCATIVGDIASEEFNQRLLRQTEAAVGPASFITSDDAITAERIQAGISGTRRSWADQDRGWIDLSRGLHREQIDETGARSSDASDETTNRGFWHRYLELMTGRVSA